MSVPRVVRISIAPVKSLGLVHPDEVEVGLRGVVGDRRFWLLDETGRLFNGKRNGPMVGVRPDWDEASRRLALAFPDGRVVEGAVELGEPVAAYMYGAPLPSHRVVGPWEKELSELVGRPIQFLWADDGAVDRGLGGGSVTLVSRGSLERLREEAGGDGPVDGRRFRMLFEIDGVRAHEEDEWLGGTVQVGDATLVFNGDVGRCAVTTQNPVSGEVDLDTLRLLTQYRPEGRSEPLPFGVYGAVAVPGRVRVGDPVQPVLVPA